MDIKHIMGSASVGFILLTEHTAGQAGRRIYIKPALAPKFKAMVEESKENHVLHQISQLRALAGTGSAYTNISDPKEHKTRCGDLDVTYFITQQTIGTDKPGVYITDIDYGLFGPGNLPGAYAASKKDNQWYVKPEAIDAIPTRNAAINGLAQSLKQAGSETMPPMVEHAYGQSGDNQVRLNAEGYTLFYNPQSVTVGGKRWNTPAQKQTNHKVSARKLADLLVDAQNRGEKVQWTIHGNGSDLLRAALQQLPGKRLSNHELMFMAPGDLLSVLPLAKKAGMGLHSEVMKYSDAELGTNKRNNLEKNATAVARVVRQFGPQHHARADEIKVEGEAARKQRIINGCVTFATLGTGTLLQSLSAQTDHRLRNAAALWSRSDNVAINPHLNPHMSKAAFNHHVKTNAGGLGASYGVTFKALLKKIKV